VGKIVNKNKFIKLGVETLELDLAVLLLLK
jgi:hypothetical protein